MTGVEWVDCKSPRSGRNRVEHCPLDLTRRCSHQLNTVHTIKPVNILECRGKGFTEELWTGDGFREGELVLLRGRLLEVNDAPVDGPTPRSM